MTTTPDDLVKRPAPMDYLAKRLGYAHEFLTAKVVLALPEVPIPQTLLDAAARIEADAAEITRLRAEVDAFSAAAIKQAQRELELRADAARYRWLRNVGQATAIVGLKSPDDWERDWLDGADLDAAIDAALAPQHTDGKGETPCTD